jgi:hypothetical protein
MQPAFQVPKPAPSIQHHQRRRVGAWQFRRDGLEVRRLHRRHQVVSNRFARTSLPLFDASDKALCWSATRDGVIGKKDNDGSYDRNDHAG